MKIKGAVSEPFSLLKPGIIFIAPTGNLYLKVEELRGGAEYSLFGNVINLRTNRVEIYNLSGEVEMLPDASIDLGSEAKRGA